MIPTTVPLMIKSRTPLTVKVSIEGMCTKLKRNDGIKIAIYLFHLLSNNFIIYPRNNISSVIPDFSAISMEAIIIKHISPAEKELTSNLPIIAKIAVTNTGRKTDIRTPHFLCSV